MKTSRRNRIPKRFTLVSDLPATWDELCALRPPRPIRNEKDYDRAGLIVNTLAVMETRTPDQEDYLDVMAALFESYDRVHHAIDTSDLAPLDMLRFLVEQHGMSAGDLGRLLGHRELGSMIMTGKRSLSKMHIQKLSAHFCVSPALFLRPDENGPSASGEPKRPATTKRAPRVKTKFAPKAVYDLA